MKAEELKVGMRIRAEDQTDRVVLFIGETGFYYKCDGTGTENSCLFKYLNYYEPVVEKKKIKLFRYTYSDFQDPSVRNQRFYQSTWLSERWGYYRDNFLLKKSICVELLKIEEKEIEIDE